MENKEIYNVPDQGNMIDGVSPNEIDIGNELQIEKNQIEESYLKDDVLVSSGYELGKHIEVKTDPVIEKINNRILQKALDANPELEAGLKNKTINDIQKYIMKQYPKQAGFMLIEFKINHLSQNTYNDLSSSEKMKLIALMKSLESGFLHPKDIKDRYRYATESVFKTLMRNFKWNQMKNIGMIESTLTKEYGVSPNEAKQYMTYLDQIQKQYASEQPQQGNIGFVIGFIAGVAITSLGFIMYDRIMNPKGMTEKEIGVIDLGDIELLASLVTSEQKFTISGSQLDKLYNTSDEASIPEEIYEKLMNAIQSRKITMEVQGKVGVEYSVDNGKGDVFRYDNKTKMINVHLSAPKFTIREQTAKVIERKDEFFQMKRFDNTEQKLLESLLNNALEKAMSNGDLIDAAATNAGRIIHGIYAPIFKSHGQQIKGVIIQIDNGPRKELRM